MELDTATNTMKEGMRKFLRDLFLEQDGDLNRESIAFFAAMLSFLIGQIRGAFFGGNWDPLGYGLTFAAIMLGGGAAAGSKRKNSYAISKLRERIDALEKRINVGP